MFTYPINLQTGPGPLLACVPWPDPEALAEAAVALANADGGSIVIGLAPDGTPAAPPSLDEAASALAAAAALCTPELSLPEPERLESIHGPLVAICVPRSSRVHALADGRVYARTGGGNRLLSGHEIKALVSARANGVFEAETVPGVTPDALDPDLIDELAARCDQPAGDLLTALGALTPGGGVTVAGLMLFGRNPQRWLPYSGVSFVRVVAGLHLPEHTVSGALVRQIETVAALIQEQMRSYKLSGHPSQCAYPAGAVLEALVNAVCHRDYRLREPVRVQLHDDRLVFSSPGGLPGFLTSAHLGDERYSRNPRLAWGLFRWGQVAEPGQGITRIRALLAETHHPPQFEAEPYRVTVRLHAAHAQPESTPNDSPASIPTAGLNRRQQVALAHVRQHGSITLRELGTLCADTSVTTLRRDLDDLAQCGRLRKVGGRGRAYYIAG